MIDDDDLLPCPQNETAFVERHRESRSHKRRPNVTEPVVIAPCMTMTGRYGLGNEFFQLVLHVLYKSRFKFYRRYRSGRTDYKNMDQAV